MNGREHQTVVGYRWAASIMIKPYKDPTSETRLRFPPEVQCSEYYSASVAISNIHSRQRHIVDNSYKECNAPERN
ncbi:hypothetical protein KIN20_020637 [Parelaphostrongylus tenuis]|uniref:Uncharacterized protein n=1 Tax=Parelaphostrongylus tenuis TaxID=148309 RepID=A0AAD5MMW7_PARTN|nr:hypothetical protein KIN20_020637 [Parelaphostrongylus tenuis]